MEKNLKLLRKKRKSNRALILGHNALDYKSVLKHPFNYQTKRGFHQPAPTSLLYDNWQDFKGDIITCHYKNFNSKFVVTVEPSPRFHESGGYKISNCPAYNKDNNEAYNGMVNFDIKPDDYYYIDIPKIFNYKNNTLMLYSGLFAIILSCLLGYEKVFTCGIDGTMIGYEGGFKYKKKHIKAMKCFVRKGTHKKVQIYENKKPTNMSEWSDWKVVENYYNRMNYVLNYCNDKYPKSKIYKSHFLSKLNTEIKNPFYQPF